MGVNSDEHEAGHAETDGSGCHVGDEGVAGDYDGRGKYHDCSTESLPIG